MNMYVSRAILQFLCEKYHYLRRRLKCQYIIQSGNLSILHAQPLVYVFLVARGYKTFLVHNSQEHEICSGHEF